MLGVSWPFVPSHFPSLLLFVRKPQVCEIMQKRREEQRKSTFDMQRMVMFSCFLIGCLLLFLHAPDDSHAGTKIRKGHRLTPTYFDSLRDDYKKCDQIDRGTAIDITKHPSMYAVAVKEIENYGPVYKEYVKEKKGSIGLDAKLIDLNNDGIDEAIVYVSDGIIRGGTGNSVFYVMKQKKKRNLVTWRIIGTLEGSVLNLDKHRTNGFLNILTSWHSSADSGYITRYRLLQGNYIETDVTEFWHDIIKSGEACYGIAPN
jgi:hypothetical protein